MADYHVRMDATSNLLIAALPEAERAHLLTLMHQEPLRIGDVLYEQGQIVSSIHFPLSGAVSLMIALEDGREMEPAIIGSEGMLGFPIGRGDDISRWRSIVQVEGEALVMSRLRMRELLLAGGELPGILTHYAGQLITLTAQSAICAQFHTLEQRTARWLLLMHDRSLGDEFSRTHNHLAAMLGAFRPSETNALNALQHRGWIELGRSRIRILNRAGLQGAACECYARVEAHHAEEAPTP